MTNVIALDPGGTTGYAVVEESTGRLREGGQWSSEEYGHRAEVLLLKWKPEVVIIERYRIFPSHLQAHTYSGVQPVEVIGALKLLCAQQEIPWVEQSPMQKKFFTITRLKYYQCYLPKLPHCHDACRHALYYLVFTKKILGLPPK